MILSDLRPQIKYKLYSRHWRYETDDSVGTEQINEQLSRMRTKVAVTVDGQTFEGYGGCKRTAKERAAAAALHKLFGM